MIIGFSGTRRGMTPWQLRCLFNWLTAHVATYEPTPAGTVIAARHGDCIGADAEFHTLCLALEIRVEIHPARGVGSQRAFCQHASITYEPRMPLERNRLIVDNSGLMIIAPAEMKEVLRSGTWSTWRYAKKQGKKILHLTPERLS